MRVCKGGRGAISTLHIPDEVERSPRNSTTRAEQRVP